MTYRVVEVLIAEPESLVRALDIFHLVMALAHVVQAEAARVSTAERHTL